MILNNINHFKWYDMISNEPINSYKHSKSSYIVPRMLLTLLVPASVEQMMKWGSDNVEFNVSGTREFYLTLIVRGFWM